MLLCDVCNAGCHATCMGLDCQAVGEWWLCATCWQSSGRGQRLTLRQPTEAQPQQAADTPARQAPRAAGGQRAEAPAAPAPVARVAAATPAVDGRTQRLLTEAVLRSAGRTRAVPVARWAPEYLAGADHRLETWLRARLAASSHTTFESQCSQFEQFRALAALPEAATPEQLARQLACWAMGRADNGYKLSTIELGVHAVQQATERQRGWEGLSRHLVLRDALAAAGRRRGAGRRPKLPVTPELLHRMVASLRSEGSWLALRDACFLTLAWCGMLRGSEALALTWSDVQTLPEGVQLLVRSSKTDQRADGAFVLLGQLPGAPLDPAAVLAAWQAACGGTPQGPAFPVYGGGKPAAKNTMLNRLRRALVAAGLTAEQAGLFGLHSLRRGGATAAARAGASMRMIQEHGRWRSDAVRQYMYADDGERWQMVAGMLSALPRG